MKYLKLIYLKFDQFKIVSFYFLGDLVESSDWIYIISSSTGVSSGKANALLSASSYIVLCRYIAPCFTDAIMGKDKSGTLFSSSEKKHFAGIYFCDLVMTKHFTGI